MHYILLDMKPHVNDIIIALRALLVLTILLCGIYPIFIWAVGQMLFMKSASGSIIRNQDGIAIGSCLIGQVFNDSAYFQSRPSAAGNGYDATASGGSNLGPLSKELADRIRARINAYRAINHLSNGDPVPADAVTASGSGLDPDISVANAMLQAPRVADVRRLDHPTVIHLIQEQNQDRQFGFLGEPRVNVLKLNLSLDRIPR
jgi:potassium-transporting ATPase KdpC subunit